MKKTLFACTLVAFVVSTGTVSHMEGQKPELQSLLLGSWTNLSQEKGAATMTITSVDPSTGEIRGKYVPPSGPAVGKEFGVVGWVSFAPPVANQHNVVTVTFSTSLTTYGSLATWTGYIKDGKIVANWLNSRPNSGYEWDHLTTGQDTWTRKSQAQ